MNNFSGNLKTEQISRWEHKLLEELSYTDNTLGTLVVPEGYVTDFATLRPLRILLTPIYATLVGYGNASSTLHDMLYASQLFDRKTCDQLYFRALRDEGTALWRSYIFYWGIRATGWYVYNNYKKAKSSKTAK